MGYPRFFSATVVGALAWAVGLPVLGHVAASDPWVRGLSYAVAGVFVAGSVVVGVVGWVRRRRTADR
jgi:membrane protein DedA with SNARE-associated domain